MSTIPSAPQFYVNLSAYISWDNSTVIQWLNECGCFSGTTITAFSNYSIVGQDLQFLTDSRLQEMGVSSLRERISYDVQFNYIITHGTATVASS